MSQPKDPNYLGERVCPECGSDPWFSQEFPRVRDENHALRNRLVVSAKEHAAEKMLWDIERMEMEEWKRSNSRKVSRQTRVIRRLEKRLRELGAFPYGESK